ncbi:hypothetical protein M378DRAFT_160916 [Amanita muscaria Koide BX008]|uniref:Uncharacterized protein n=1 Tax=Amanita muscaria (strain Koide BX008) TaxID=946122 RepID=A0A0C2THP4_AMAMK|nr:hypothetical protein M378DRAFT_160916 [Amanita muscaria Koide BX008]
MFVVYVQAKPDSEIVQISRPSSPAFLRVCSVWYEDQLKKAHKDICKKSESLTSLSV